MTSARILGIACAAWLSVSGLSVLGMSGPAAAQDLSGDAGLGDDTQATGDMGRTGGFGMGGMPGDAGPDGARAEPDGEIGLIEAPEGNRTMDGDDLATGTVAMEAGGFHDLSGAETRNDVMPDDLGEVVAGDTPPAMNRAGASMSFAQVQSRRMFGPIDHPPVVVELFTSQGCSSCPPADDMLADLSDRDDILALSWHVDYWDYLGWADDFARPEFTRRQQAYAHEAGERAIYTPQMIVGGTETLIAVRPAELMGLLQAQMARPPVVMVSASNVDGAYRIDMTPRAAIPGRVAIILVRYAPRRDVAIKAGENRGIAVTYRNVVLAAERVAEWDGRAPLRLTVRPDASSGDAFPGDTRHAILAQELGEGDRQAASGPILAAIRLD